MSTGSSFRVRSLPGSAVVARAGHGVLVVDPANDTQHGVVDALLEVLRETCADAGIAPGDALVRRLVSAVVARPPAEVPPFAAVAPGSDGLAVLLTPGMELTWESGGEQQRLSGSSATNWLDRVVPGVLGTVRVGVEPVGGGEPAPFTDLREGVVAGGGAVIGPMTDAPAPTLDPEPSARSFAVVDLGGLEAAESRGPLPVADAASAAAVGAPSLSEGERPADPAVPAPADVPVVRGKRCVRSHFNHPDARYCNACGINFHQQTVNIVEGPRPPLGILLLDDGSGFALDVDYVVGREPELAPEVVAGRARPLALPDPQRSVSRVHASIELVGWEVTLTDRGSANGTFVLLPGAGAWSPLPAEQATMLPTGSRVAFGNAGRTIVFESHHVSDR